MPHKKTDVKQPSEEDVLVERVDALMDIKRTNTSPASPTAPAPDAIDIFKDLNTKPPLVVETPQPVEAAPEPEEPELETEEPQLEEEATEPEVPIEESTPAAPTVDSIPTSPTINITVTENLDDDATEKAVDEIVVADSDALLAAEDVVAKVTPPVEPPKKRFRLFK